jgi:hypothetical protein
MKISSRGIPPECSPIAEQGYSIGEIQIVEEIARLQLSVTSTPRSSEIHPFVTVL